MSAKVSFAPARATARGARRADADACPYIVVAGLRRIAAATIAPVRRAHGRRVNPIARVGAQAWALTNMARRERAFAGASGDRRRRVNDDAVCQGGDTRNGI